MKGWDHPRRVNGVRRGSFGIVESRTFVRSNGQKRLAQFISQSYLTARFVVVEGGAVWRRQGKCSPFTSGYRGSPQQARPQRFPVVWRRKAELVEYFLRKMHPQENP